MYVCSGGWDSCSGQSSEENYKRQQPQPHRLIRKSLTSTSDTSGVFVYTCIHLWIHTCNTCYIADIPIHTYIHTQWQTCHVYLNFDTAYILHRYVFAYKHILTHTYITYIYSYIHTYIYTYIYTRPCISNCFCCENSFSFGLEQSKILIGNLEWKNPSKFKETPCVLFLKEISISFSMLSVLSGRWWICMYVCMYVNFIR